MSCCNLLLYVIKKTNKSKYAILSIMEMVMIIRRDTYLNKLISKKQNGLIKVITGIRRCGKSYLLFNLFRDYLIESGVDSSHIIEMTFDSYENKRYRNPEIFFPYIKEKISDSGLYFILLDEIQLLEDFESILNSLSRLPNTDIYVTGSNAKFLSKDIITEFRGRGDEVHMYPLSFSEFMSVYDGDKRDGWNEYMVYGGIPLVLSQKTHEQKSAFLKSLFNEVYITDILGRNRIRNKEELEELLDIVSSAVGSLTNSNKLAQTFKSIKNKSINKSTIKKYLDSLCDSFLIEESRRYDVKGRKYIGTSQKYYFSDMGLRNARLNFRQIEETHIMENIIYNELRMRGYDVDVGVVTANEITGDGKKIRKQREIDFVCNMGSKRYYIQSAFALPDRAKIEQEEKPLLLSGDGFKKIIVTKDAPAPLYDEQGILSMSIYDFLLNSDSLNF